MEYFQATAAIVDVEQDERGAADGVGVAAEAADQAAHELRFAGAQVAVEGDALAAAKRAREFRGDGFGLLDAGRLACFGFHFCILHSDFCIQKRCSHPLGSSGWRRPSW